MKANKFNENSIYILQWNNFTRIVCISENLSICDDEYGDFFESVCTPEEVLAGRGFEIIQEWK